MYWDIIVKAWIYLDWWIDSTFFISIYLFLYLGESFGSVWILTRGGKGLLLRMTPSDNVLPAKQNILSFWISFESQKGRLVTGLNSKMYLTLKAEFTYVIFIMNGGMSD